MTGNVSLKELAEQLGVSIAVVSYVLNGKARENRVSIETEANVLKLAKKLNYQPNHIAQSLRKGSTKTIGLIMADISNKFFGDLATAVQEEANIHGYKVVFGNTSERADKSAKLIAEFKNWLVSGIIITPVEGSYDQIKELAKTMPTVKVDRYFDSRLSSTVMLDNYSAAYDAVDHLYKNGYDNVGMIMYNSNMLHASERYRGFIDRVKDEGVSEKDVFVGRVNHFTMEEEMEQQLNEFFETNSGSSRNALLFSTNSLTVSGLYYFQKNKVKIPDDLAVVGFDGGEAFDFFYPPITYLEQPVAEMGRQAVKLLIEQINGKKELIHVQLGHRLIDRESSKKI